MKWPKRKKVDEVIKVLPSKNENYSISAHEVLSRMQAGEIKGEEGEGVIIAVVEKNGRVKIRGYGDKTQVISVAFNMILQAAGLSTGENDKVTEEESQNG